MADLNAKMNGSGVVKIAKIAIDKASYGYDMLYSYTIPEDIKSSIICGSRVLVPFGKGNRKRIGIVLAIEDNSGEISRIKPISSIMPNDVPLSEEMLEIVHWLKDNTLCTYFEAVKTIMPSGFGVNISQKYRTTQDISGIELDDEERALTAFLSNANSQKEIDSLLDYEGNSQKERVVKSLIDKGVIEVVQTLKRKVGDEAIQMARLSEKYLSGENSFKLTPKQRQVIDCLLGEESASIKEICYICSVTPVVVKNLEKAGAVEIFEQEVLRTPEAMTQKNESVDDIELSDAQSDVYEGIGELIDAGKPQVALLRGVTGSGKTQVYLKLIDKCLKAGKQAIMLIPEISLTPQMLHIFQNLFGDLVAIMHSGLSLGQRVDEYKRIKSGEARIVVGTRSAVFAPLENIGIIIMDEEGEHTYKSESSPRYHAREVAKLRCVKHNALLLLGSATPSIDSYYFARTGRYKLFELTQRYADAVLPRVFMVDMQQELANGNTTQLSYPLVQEIEKNLENGEQSILLLNRRGYHTYVACMTCKEPLICPNCNVALTFHKTNGRVICHYCGYSQQLEHKCKECGSEYMKLTGAGTQRVVDELRDIFPSIRILRMDADTTYSRFAYEKGFSAFGRGEYDIMVGTQMIAKGLDFPNVTLVGVLSVDKALYAGDFRSYERTFSLVTQVVGRGGRGDIPARAYIQTFSPEHYVLTLAAMQDFESFYEDEAAIRKALLYPPFCDLCVIGFSSLVEIRAENAANIFTQMLAKRLQQEGGQMPIRALGPAKAILGKLNGRFRYRIIIKCKNTSAFRKVISDVMIEAGRSKDFANVHINVDLNGDIGL